MGCQGRECSLSPVTLPDHTDGARQKPSPFPLHHHHLRELRQFHPLGSIANHRLGPAIEPHRPPLLPLSSHDHSVHLLVQALVLLLAPVPRLWHLPRLPTEVSRDRSRLWQTTCRSRNLVQYRDQHQVELQLQDHLVHRLRGLYLVLDLPGHPWTISFPDRLPRGLLRQLRSRCGIDMWMCYSRVVRARAGSGL